VLAYKADWLAASHHIHTSNELFMNVNVDDLNDLEPPKYGFLVFFAILSCDTHFKSELRIKLLLFYCMMYTDRKSGRIASHVSFVQITCLCI